MHSINAHKNSLNSCFRIAREEIIGAIYPSRCGLCGDWCNEGICDSCWSEMHPVTRLKLLLADPVSMVFHYEGRAGQAVRRLKYDLSTCLAEPMAIRLGNRFNSQFAGAIDLVIPTPIHWTRRMERGFNQSELLLSHIPSNLISEDALVRTRKTKPQASLDPMGRATNLSGAFAARPVVSGLRVLLVDDVITSGATVDECARALQLAGARSVSALAFAGVP